MTRALWAVLPAVATTAVWAHSASAQPATPAAGEVRGVVYDSLARRPLDSAIVQLVRVDDPTVAHSAITDSAGAYHIVGVPAGRYLAGFLHPELDLLGLELSPRVVEVGPGGARADLALPPLARVRALVCGAPGGAPAGAPNAVADSSGVLAGRLRDAATGDPAGGATVTLTWTEWSIGPGGLRSAPRRVPVTTGPAGTYLICGTPPGEAFTVSAAAPGRASGLVAVDVPPGALALRDLALGDTAAAPPPRDTTPGAAPPRRPARGTARLAGRVVRASDGRPVPRARVAVWDTDAADAATDAGDFTLGGLPAGTRTVEVRAIGFEPRRVAVDLAPGRQATVQIRLDPPVPTLDRVTVLGKRRPRAPFVEQFLRHKQSNAFGRFLTAADIERAGAIALTDALRMTPGVHVVPAGAFANVLLGRGNCRMAVVLDGLPLVNGATDLDATVRPQDVAGIEVYAAGAGAPPELLTAGGGGCGVVAVWTKR